MLFVNKLTNLVFNAKKINANHNLLHFSLIYIFEKNKNNLRNEMHECYAMQILETKKTKNNGHKG